MNWGLDALGAVKFGDLMLREMPAGWMFGVFTNTFGDAKPLVEAIAKQGRAAGIRLQLLWKDDHEFGGADFQKIVAEAKRFAPLMKKYPAIKWYVSGATEHKLNPTLALHLASRVCAQIPSSAIYVNNPWEGKGATLPDYLNEVHGSAAHPPEGVRRFAYSCDGSDCFDFDITGMKERMRGAEYFMFWTSQFNRRKNANDTTPRPQRKAKPTSELIDAAIYLHNDQGAPSLPKNYLVKPKADQHMVPPEPRALKPVIIIPQKVDRLELVADNGQVIGVSGKPEPFNDGRWRYYFSDRYGFQWSEKARRIQGHPVVKLRVGKRIAGTVNMAFRQGGFR